MSRGLLIVRYGSRDVSVNTEFEEPVAEYAPASMMTRQEYKACP